jgi:Ca-activated chloride channel family protein
MSKEEKLKQKELKRLLKKMKQKGTPTMMYQMGNDNKSKRSGGANPW